MATFFRVNRSRAFCGGAVRWWRDGFFLPFCREAQARTWRGGNQRGFTLVEGLAVLVVLGILAVVVLNRFAATNLRASAEADALRTALRYAQSRAMADVYTWGVAFSGTGYRLVSDNPGQPAPVLPGQASGSHDFPEGVSCSGAPVIFFDWRGEPVATAVKTPGGATTVSDQYQYINIVESGQTVTVTVTPHTGFVP